MDHKLKQDRAKAICEEHYQQLTTSVDRGFAWLLSVEWLIGIAFALVISPHTWRLNFA